MKKFRGTGVAIVTPFKNDFSIDFKALGKVVNHVINGGVNYIVAMGTTGEAPTLTKDEKQAIITFVADTIDNRVPLMIGIGGNNTQEVVNSIIHLDMTGVDAILSVVPYYNKPGQRGMFQHFKAIANCSSLPIIMYNVPGRTSSNLSSETCIELATSCENIVGIKEASGDMNQIMRIVKGKPDNFLVISGDDALTIPVISAGGAGVISVLANAYPAATSEIVNNALKGNFKTARELHFRYMEAIDLLFADGNPSGVKTYMNLMGLCQNNLRLPLVTVSRTIAARIQKSFEELQ